MGITTGSEGILAMTFSPVSACTPPAVTFVVAASPATFVVAASPATSVVAASPAMFVVVVVPSVALLSSDLVAMVTDAITDAHTTMVVADEISALNPLDIEEKK